MPAETTNAEVPNEIEIAEKIGTMQTSVKERV